MSGGVFSRQSSTKAKLFTGASLAAMALASSLSSPASARNYAVSNATEFDNAVAAANADPDPSSTITLTADIAGALAALPALTKPISIDTNGFTLPGFVSSPNNGNTLTLSGTIVGNTAQNGVNFSSSLAPSSLINNGSVTAGADGTSLNNIGIQMNGAGTFVNNGTVTGGANTGAGAAGVGFNAANGAHVTNNGLIQGGKSVGGAGAIGLALGGSASAVDSSLINNGTIRGGDGATTGGVGLRLGFRAGYLENNGTIIGGNGAAAISYQVLGGTWIVNNRTIQAGAGATNAITSTSGALTLELHAGSTITGNVIARAAVPSDVLRLGGTGSDTFDLSSIGAAAQYQNFDRFEKTGSGTWLLTGNGSTATDWTISDGTLLVGDHTTPTSLIGDITNAGTLGGSGTIIGDVASSGTVAPGNSIGTLTISGNYTGTGGTLEIESVLGGDSSATDRLVVTGNTSGSTNVKVINVGGAGAQTIEGIKIVDVGGVSAGTFNLLGDYVFEGEQAVVGGAYAYRLYQNGVRTPTDGDWYLRSALVDAGVSAGPLYQAGAPIYEAYTGVLQSFMNLPLFSSVSATARGVVRCRKQLSALKIR